MSESAAEYGNNYGYDNTPKIKILGNINVVITVYYDMMDKGVIEKNPKQIEDYIYNTYVTKTGKPISRSTIYTALKDYRPEKRAKGKKKINISELLIKE